MSTKNELEKELDLFVSIYFDILESYNIVTYLHKEEDNEKIHYEKTVSSFLHTTYYGYWRIAVIELCNVFINSRNSDFAIEKFLLRIKENYYSLSSSFESVQIDTWINDIKNKSEIIDKLKIQRDKIHAHRDKNFDKYDCLISFNDFKDLLDLLKTILKTLKHDIFEKNIHLEDMFNSPSKNLEGIIERIVSMDNEIKSLRLELKKFQNKH